MASVKCNKCGYGIHYHGEPSGIEYTFIVESDWGRITSARFNARSKEYSDDKTAPLLFRSDTIEEDFANALIRFWKCPSCGSLIFFDKEGKVTKTYVPINHPSSLDITPDISGIVYDDFSWDSLTEAAIPDAEISQLYPPSGRIHLTENLCIISDNSAACSYYQKL